MVTRFYQLAIGLNLVRRNDRKALFDYQHSLFTLEQATGTEIKP